MKFGLFYQLPCAPEQQTSSRYQQTLGQIQYADELGFDTAWLAELHFNPRFSVMPAPLIFAAVIAQHTKRIRIGTAVALLLVSLTLVLAFRSIRYGLVSLIPNIAPAVLAFGFWGLTVGQVNLGLSAVAAMTIGIVVDDTIHFLAKYLRARREQKKSPEDAVRFAFHTVAPAMLFTSIVLAAGFLILTLSSFDLNSSMGKLTAITIGFALATDFLMLPPILIGVGRFTEQRKAAAVLPLALENE